jgi:hypothetical protein
MILGPRCNAMRENHCQCPNATIAGSQYCKLHSTPVVSTQAQPAKVLNLTQKELKAPLSNKS